MEMGQDSELYSDGILCAPRIASTSIISIMQVSKFCDFWQRGKFVDSEI